LAALEREGKCKAVVTQNIDGLHQAAGSKVVYELHGSTLRNYCTRCGKFFPVSFIEDAAGVGDGVPRCDECGGIVKPDVVLYEEGLDEQTMENAVNAIRNILAIWAYYKGLDFQYLYADGITGYELKFTTFQVGIGIYSVQIIVCVAFAAVLLLSHIRYKKLQKGGA
jgi:hypothetical protein